MKVLHDWDRIEVNGRWALNRGLSLMLYALSRKVGILNKITFIRENTLKIEGEKLAYMEILIKLNKICRVDQVFGICDLAKAKYGEEIKALALKYDLDIRGHIHMGEDEDPARARTWTPPLEAQTRQSWRFDTDYEMGTRAILGPDERPIFHIDRPFHLSLYIKYLFEVGYI